MTLLFRIGARGSPLSLAQTGWTRDRLAEALGVPTEARADALPILPFTTTGDRIQDRPLQEAGGKGLFTKELDEALLDGRIDLAIHSMKDLPVKLPDGIALVATPVREDRRDAFLSLAADSLRGLPDGAHLGTASLRRQAQALHVRPDLRVSMLRGNVQTRLDKLTQGAVDATFLAVAGLNRLGLGAHALKPVDPEDFPPAIGQGALAITARTGDTRAIEAAQLINHAQTALEVAAERAFLAALDGSCRTPIAGYARMAAGGLRFLGEALTPDGASRWRRDATLTSPTETSAAEFAFALGREIKAEGGALLDFSRSD